MQIRRTDQPATHHVVLLAGVSALLLFAAGCSFSVTGDWRMVKALPNKEVFAIDDARFSRDGSFTADVTIEGKTSHQQGRYEFNGFKLTLHPRAGGQHRWNALARFGRLEVLDGERKVILEKVKKSRKRKDDDQDEASRKQ